MKNLNNVQFTLIQGELIVTHQGKSSPWKRCPLEVIDRLQDSLDRNPRARQSLAAMRIPESRWLEKYAACQFATGSDCEKANSCPQCGNLCANRSNPQTLTPRDIRILRYLSQGQTTATVANRMCMTECNLRRIVAKIKHDYNISTHFGLGAWAAKTLHV